MASRGSFVRTIQQPTPVKQRQSKAEDVLELLLQGMNSGSLLVRHLLVYLPDGQRPWHQVRDDRKALTSFSPNENTGTKSAL